MEAASDMTGRFTDRHVILHPELRELALQYVRNYRGEFAFLLDVQTRLQRDDGSRLSTSTVRGILNCMRYDPLASADLPCPEPVASLIQRQAPRPPRRLQAVPDYRPPVRLATVFHKPYLLNTTPKMPSNNPKAHILNHTRSGVWADNGNLIYRLFAWCGWSASNYGCPTSTSARMADDPKGRQVCGSCSKLIQKAARAI